MQGSPSGEELDRPGAPNVFSGHEPAGGAFCARRPGDDREGRDGGIAKQHRRVEGAVGSGLRERLRGWFCEENAGAPSGRHEGVYQKQGGPDAILAKLRQRGSWLCGSIALIFVQFSIFPIFRLSGGLFGLSPVQMFHAKKHPPTPHTPGTMINVEYS